MLAAHWLAAFAEHVEPAVAARVRDYSDRALTRWADHFYEPAWAPAGAAASQIAYLELTYSPAGRRTGHEHVYGDGHRVRCAAVAPFTLPDLTRAGLQKGER